MDPKTECLRLRRRKTWCGKCANCKGLSQGSPEPLTSLCSQLTPQPGPPAVLAGPLRQLKGVRGRGRGSRQHWPNTGAWPSGPPLPAPPPRLGTILGGVDPAPTFVSALALQAAGGVALLHGLGLLTRLQLCLAARCHMPTRPPPSTNLPTQAAWASSASEKVWHRHHSFASHPHCLKFWAGLPTVLASTPFRA